MNIVGMVRPIGEVSVRRAVLGLLGLAVTAAAQVKIGEFDLGAASALHGERRLVGLGDINADGQSDFAVSVVPIYPTLAGFVQIRSGADFSVLQQWTGQDPADGFALAMDSAGDVDGDGLQDVVVGSPWLSGSGRVVVFSSATGGVLYDVAGEPETGLGFVVAGVDDLDGDGRADFAAGAPSWQDGTGAEQSGYVRFFSGASGIELAKLVGDDGGLVFGMFVRPAGDTNADGVPDVALTCSDLAGQTHLRVYSGAWIGHGALPAVLADVSPLGNIGSMDRAGDLDGDGIDDLIFGTPSANQYKGGFFVLSGEGQGTLLQFVSPAFVGLGSRVAGAGDFNHDGVPDLLASGSGFGFPFAVPGGAVVVSGKDGALLGNAPDTSAGTGSYGFGLADLGDVNADGTPDWAVSESEGASVSVYSQVAVWTDLGQGLGGALGIPPLSGTGLLLGGDPVSLQLAGALPSSAVALVLGANAVDLPFKGGVLVPHPGWIVALVTDPLGSVAVTGTWPVGMPPGELWCQAWLADATALHGYAASNALHLQWP